ncbi:MAG: LemA family protein [Acidobacteria bacterium]|nr:LemA family protein [Acidobacteriota bacterium]
MGTAVWVAIIVVVALVLLLALYLWVTYNSLVTLRSRVDEAWKDISVQLQRRAELIPPLLDAIRDNAAHERSVFEAVTAARDESIAAASPADASVAENHMQQALKSTFAVAESFPQLMASPGFLQMQGDLVDSENKIQASRRFYNGGVREFNTRIQVFPNNVFAKRLGFGSREFFEAAEVAAISEPPRVQF